MVSAAVAPFINFKFKKMQTPSNNPNTYPSIVLDAFGKDLLIEIAKNKAAVLHSLVLTILMAHHCEWLIFKDEVNWQDNPDITGQIEPHALLKLYQFLHALDFNPETPFV